MAEGSESGRPEQGPSSKAASSFESAGGRLRFTVSLQPGETTIVSWKKLLSEANLSNSNQPESSSGPPFEAQCCFVSEQPPPVVPSSSKQATENEPNDSQDQAGSNRLSTVIERIERMYAGNGSCDEEGLVLDNVPDNDEYDTEDSFIDDTELDDYFQVDNSAIKHDGFFVNRGKLECIEPIISEDQQLRKRSCKDLTRHGGSDDGHNPHKIMKILNKGKKASSFQRSSTTQSPKEATPNIYMLEKAIKELEKIVAEFRPPTAKAQDPDNASPAVKRRLPPEIKQKLAEVARIAQASDGKVPKDVINHLMSIVGHLMHIRTLKRNLKAMANMGLSAKQEWDNRIQKIKQEVAEMVKLRILRMKSKLEQHDANSGDFQEAGPEEREALKCKYSMDDVLENKICDLYDLYVERLEEDSGPPVRRLYEELALLWPSGVMHTDGIKRAIYSAKYRKGICSLRKKKKALPPKAENTNNATQASHIHEKLSSDSRGRGSTLTSNPIPSAAAGHIVAHPPVSIANRPNQEKPKQEKMKKGCSSSNPIDITPSNELPKKKVKRMPNAEVTEAQLHLEKLVVSPVEKRSKQHKHSAVPLSKSNFQPDAP